MSLTLPPKYRGHKETLARNGFPILKKYRPKISAEGYQLREGARAETHSFAQFQGDFIKRNKSLGFFGFGVKYWISINQ